MLVNLIESKNYEKFIDLCQTRIDEIVLEKVKDLKEETLSTFFETEENQKEPIEPCNEDLKTELEKIASGKSTSFVYNGENYTLTKEEAKKITTFYKNKKSPSIQELLNDLNKILG